MAVKNKVQLLTYPDGLGGDLPTLGRALDELFPGLFEGGIHLLPPFPSSGDRGFAPLTYEEIDPRFGSWQDIKRLSERHDLMLDLIVNHVSCRSPYFSDFLARGRDSEWADLFVTLDMVWPDGRPVEADVAKIFLRRPRPWSTYDAGAPSAPLTVWTTFGKTDPSDQIDMNWRSPHFWRIVEEMLGRLAANGVKQVRLDAVGYLAKRAGTSCFFIQPETSEILSRLDELAERYSLTLLPEVHGRPDVQRDLASRGSWTYDFVLPYRVLEALILGSAARLALHLADRRGRQFTMLDCHDGIPVKPDLDGQYDRRDVRVVVQTCLDRGGNLSLVYAPEHRDPDGFDVHQIRGTLYSLLGRDDDALVAARAIQLFGPGVPQVYYVGLLAGENDEEAGRRTGDGREVNRHNFTLEEMRGMAGRSVVKRLERLIRLRNSHSAFDGRFEASLVDRQRLRLSWQKGADRCVLDVCVSPPHSVVELTTAAGARETIEL